MPPKTGKADYVIQEVAGCGPFQVILTFLVYFVAKMTAVFSIHFLIFCNYNPGWRCLDDVIDDALSNTNHTSTSSDQGGDFNTTGRIFLQQGGPQNFQNQNETGESVDVVEDSGGEFIFNNCTLFESCRNIEFDSTTKTLVSEWGLLCDRAWIGSLIMSLQMMGLLVGSFVIGHLGDWIGRRTTIYGALVVLAILNVISVFSTSWQMLAVVRFFLGVACVGNLSIVYVYVAEWVTLKWRVRVVSIPYWPTTAIIFGLTLMTLRDWRQILYVTIGLSVIGFLPVVWMPESLRWLEVKQKTHQFLSTAKKITRVNGKTFPSDYDAMMMSVQSKKSNSLTKQKKKPKPYVLLHLFKKGYTLNTILVAYEWLACSICHYTLNFGIRTLSGNFYVNMLVFSTCEIPFNFVAMGISKIFGRKISKLACLVIVIACFITACCFNLSSTVALKTTGVFVVVMVLKATFASYWCFLYSHTAELYPTVVRSLAINWGSLFARVGGTIAPFLVPSDPDSNYISYAAMAVLGLLSSLVLLNLPETKGVTLKETFEDSGSVGGSGGVDGGGGDDDDDEEDEEDGGGGGDDVDGMM